MEKRRFYCEKITKPVCELSGTEARHIISVLRLKKSEQVELFDGRGIVAQAIIKDISGQKVILEVLDIQIIEQRKNQRIIIAVSIAKGERFDWLIEKCTELGVDRICPVVFERTVKYATGSQTIQRWHNLSIAAAKQSGSNVLPIIDNPVLLKDILSKLKIDYPSSDILLGLPDLQADSIMQYSFRDKDVVALIGPEGGLTSSEQQLCLEAGAKPIRLVDSVLRVETAALAFASLFSVMRSSQKKF
jgi:16S rRNA (uracil1498-N3)-methyltransferase